MGAVSGLLLLSAFGCSGSSSSSPSAIPGLKDVQSAPAKIQSAAKAVVRIRTARHSATASFISADGLLLTNEHVLGDSVCPVEGCYVQLTFMHQRGEAQQQPRTVFAKPVAVNIGLDMAVAQLYDQPGGAKLATPDFLSFNPQTPAALVGKHVTIVGHPEGYLKKWNDGSVASVSGQWFKTNVFILPGDSGSPVLDDDGKIVGLIHRGPTAQDLFTSNGATEYSIGTASAPLVAALNAPLPGTVISLGAPTTADAFVKNNLVYLNARASSVNIGGSQNDALSLLGNACDAALARQDFTSPDDLESVLTPCYDAQTWIECRSDASTVPYGKVCPAASDQTAWANRFSSANDRWVAMNGELDYYSVSFAMARLKPTTSQGISAGGQALQQALNQSSPVLDPVLANYLAAFNILFYGATDLRQYVTGYTSGSSAGAKLANQAWSRSK